MNYNQVINMVLSLLREYRYGNYTFDEIKQELGVCVNIVLAKAQLFDVSFDSDFMEFNRDLTNMEATIISYGLLMQWLSPSVYNSEVLESQLTSKEFTTFSNANRINSAISLYKLASNEFYYLITIYDDKYQRALWEEEDK